MRCKWHFRDSPQNVDLEYPKFQAASKWEPPSTHYLHNLETFLSLVRQDILSINDRKRNFPNLTPGEKLALENLAEANNIVIKPADKGSAVVVWDMSDYLEEAEKQLTDHTTYKKVKFDMKTIIKLSDRSNKFFKTLFDKKLITKRVYEYFVFPFKNSAKLAVLYLLPKIHKRTLAVPGRPVISNCGAATEKASEFLNFHLKPIMQTSETYLRDSSDFLEKIRALGPLPREAILVTADVVGLYPSIPHSEGLAALREALDLRTNINVSTDFLIQMAEFVLTNNFFGFSSNMYHQLKGTAIGTKCAPPYACIFMDKLEKTMLASQVFKPIWWKRYIDDILKIWIHGERKLREFIIALNEWHPTIKFTFELAKETVNSEYFQDLETVKLIPGKAINFLDLSIWIENNEIQSDLYCKPTDCHQYLSFTSCHPYHTKRSIVFSQTLRIKGICSSVNRFEAHMLTMKSWISKRNYPLKLIEEQVSRARGFVRNTSDHTKNGANVLVVTYHPALENLKEIMKKHFYLIQTNSEMKAVFSRPPMISFRNPKTIRNFLVRAKSPPEVGRKGSFRCNGPRCKICAKVVETDQFTSFVTGDTYSIYFELNCNSKCLIYLLNCQVCGKQLTGECTTPWRDRWNNYLCNMRKALMGEHHLQKEVHAHFKLPGHTSMEKDVNIIFIDKTDSTFPKRRGFLDRHSSNNVTGGL